MKVTVTADATKLCPYAREDDHGTVEVTFDVVEGDAPELHRLGKMLESSYDQARSHEEFTRWVHQNSGAIHVITRWTTAGMLVVCEIGRKSPCPHCPCWRGTVVGPPRPRACCHCEAE